MTHGQNTLLTDDECKKIIKKLAMKLHVRAELITTLLLSDLDKSDMKVACLPIASLERHIRAWVASGMPNQTGYVRESKKDLVFNPRITNKELVYRKPFVKCPFRTLEGC